MMNRNFPSATTHATFPQYICSSERFKLIGSIDGRFPDYGHHLEKEMGGAWLHPIKLLDGFWLRFHDHNAENVDVWALSGEYKVFPWGNQFRYASNLGHTNLVITQRQICPEEAAGIIVEYEIHNKEDSPCKVDLEWLVRSDLRPVWLSEDGGIRKDGPDTCVTTEDGFLIKGFEKDWYAAIGTNIPCASHKIGQHFGPEITHGDGISLSLFHTLNLKPKETQILCFYISGSYLTKEDCLIQQNLLKEIGSFQQALVKKEERYHKILSRSCLRTGDDSFDEICDWLKVHIDWLTVDAGKYGRGLTAGIPEYIWWFGCDNFYSIQGLLATGDFQLARDTLQLLIDYSIQYNGNGKIVHEITTAGVCSNDGNTQETAQFVTALWMYYEWTGDLTLISANIDYVKKSIAWLKDQQTDGEFFPIGYGIIEIAGLNSKMIDTAVYTIEAFRCYSSICELIDEIAEAEGYKKAAQIGAAQLNTLMWNEDEGLYCDAFTSYKEVKEKKDAILGNASTENYDKTKEVLEKVMDEKSHSEGRSGWLLNHNWVINTPMEVGIAPKHNADIALKNLHTPQYIGPYGMYLSGISQTEMMTISTGVMAVGQARYGYADRALELLETIFKTFGMVSPGCMAEMSPDYGCFVQAWTIYSVFVPIVKYFFGIQPQVKDGESIIVIDPCMPSRWNDVRIDNVRVLDGELSLSFKREDGVPKCKVEFTGKAKIVIVGDL